MAQINQTQKVKLMMQTKKIPNIHGLVEKVDYDAKLTDIKQNTQYQWLKYYVALTAVENKIPMLVKKTDYDTKISDIKSKCITTTDCNKFTNGIVANKIKSEGLVDKSDIAGLININK